MAHSIHDLLRSRGQRELVTVAPKATVSEAIGLMQTKGISQLPVLQDGKPVGSVQEVTLARVLHDHSDPDQVIVGEIMARPLPTLETTVHRRGVPSAACGEHRRARGAERRGGGHRDAC